MKCNDCGYELESPAECHPHAFCVLVKAGYNPLTVVLDAVSQLSAAASDATRESSGPTMSRDRNSDGKALAVAVASPVELETIV